MRLRERLYESFYTPGAPVPAGGVARPTRGEPGAFAARLAAANVGDVSRQPGWRVVSVDGDAVVLEQDGLRVMATGSEVVTPIDEIFVGAEVEAWVPSVMEANQPGFLVLLGERTLRNGPDGQIDRLYWHARSRGAPRLVAELSAALSGASVPFRLKAPAEGAAYSRCDAVVLYTPRRDRGSVTSIAQGIRTRLASDLDRATPALTCRLGAGLALAEEPPGGHSFGEHRCGLLAEALLSAAESGGTGTDARLAAIRDRLSREGIDLDSPWRSGSVA